MNVASLCRLTTRRTGSSRALGTLPRQALEGSSYDVGIVGGGVMGSSIALHLAAKHSGLRIAVFERDPTYEWASAPRSAGGIRQQFSLAENVKLSLYGVEFLKSGLQEWCADVDVDTDVQFRENGYLLLAPPGEAEAVLRENVALQHAVGADWIALLDAAELKARFPWLSTRGIALGAYGTRNEGYFDPWAFLQAMRKGSMAKGVEFIQGDVASLKLEPSGKISDVFLKCGETVSVGTLVNAAGAFGGSLVSMCGPNVTPLPVVPRKRCMWSVYTNAEHASDNVTPVAPENTPLTIDPSGVYFRSEGSSRGRFVCGVSPRPEDDPDSNIEDLAHANHDLFEDTIWPALATRAPAFEALKIESSWAGFYEYNTLDQNGVVGWHPEVTNMLVACGFSGHGLQQSPGVGLACSELLMHGSFQTLDLSRLGYDRIVRGEPVYERGIY